MEHGFDVDLACRYGILEAILLKNIEFWINKNEANGVNFHDGCYWTFNSTKAFSKLFPYASQKRIQNALAHLKEEGLIITGNYNSSSYDRTLWYALTRKGKSIMPKSKMENAEMENGDAQKGVTNTIYEPQIINTPSSAISSVDTTDIATEEEESSSKKLSKKSSSSGKTLREDFEEIWKLYPNKQGKKKAFAAYERAIRDGVENADILDGVKRYAKYCHDRRDEKRYIKHGDTWFNGACWQDEYDDTPSRPQSALEQGTHLNENLHRAYEREQAEGRINEYGEAPF